MPNYNKVIIVGHVTRDPKVRAISDNATVCKFGLATNEKWKTKDGEKKEKAIFIDVEAWGRLADTCGKYLKKGKPVLVEGSLDLQQWETQSAEKRSKISIRASNVQFLSGGNGEARASGAGESAPASTPAPQTSDAPDDEPPF